MSVAGIVMGVMPTMSLLRVVKATSFPLTLVIHATPLLIWPMTLPCVVNATILSMTLLIHATTAKSGKAEVNLGRLRYRPPLLDVCAQARILVFDV